MIAYLLRRLILLPITLFFIILVNFVIINLAPGEPTTLTEISTTGEAVRRGTQAVTGDMRYLQFREFYGLTLPILFNPWPFYSLKTVTNEIKESLDASLSIEKQDELRLKIGDQARFIMDKLLHIMEDPKSSNEMKEKAVRFFIRGGVRQAVVSPSPTEEEKIYNEKIAKENYFLIQQLPEKNDPNLQKKIEELSKWYKRSKEEYQFEPTTWQKLRMFFFETRFFRYMTRVVTLDFGTLRNDPNKSVISEVTKRFKYSLTLSIIPLLLTVILCQLFGFFMAYHQNTISDLSLNLLFLLLYAAPIFVVAPFLIEKGALHNNFPGTSTPIPIGGFSSPEDLFSKMTSWERIVDILLHLALPFMAVMYGSLAAQTRLTRTAVLEVMRQDYVRTAKAKGVSSWNIMVDHVGRNAAITIVTAVASSFGAVLGGSLIVETLFDINGFGKFFYDAVINRDYNVIMFSAISGSFLALVGYFIADFLYMWLDPRVTLE